MFVSGDRVIGAVGDLVRAADCEFALLRAVDAAIGSVSGSADSAIPVVRQAAVDPDRLRRFGDTLVRIPPPEATGATPAARLAALTAAAEQTATALRAGAPAIYGAVFFDGRFACGVDLLVRDPDTGHYTLHAATPGGVVGTGGWAADSGRAAIARGASSDPPGTAPTAVPTRLVGVRPEYGATPLGGSPRFDAVGTAPRADSAGGFARAERDNSDGSGAGQAESTGPSASVAETEATAADPVGRVRAEGEATDIPDDEPPMGDGAATTTDLGTVAGGEPDSAPRGGAPQSDPAGSHGVTADFRALRRELAAGRTPFERATAAVSAADTDPFRESLRAQLAFAACAAALADLGVAVDPVAWLTTSAGVRRVRVEELTPVFRARRARVTAIVEEKLTELLPVQWGDPRFLACGRCASCRDAVRTARDLLLVAGIRPNQRARLREAGVLTIDRLAITDTPVAGLTPRTVTSLREQAELQLRRERCGAPAFALRDATALGALPAPSDGDLALIIDLDARGAITAVELADARTVVYRPTPIGPGAPADEAALLDELFDIIGEHRALDPDLRVYHYGSAVRTALFDWAGRVGTGADQLDELLAAGALFDLAPIVRTALLIGEQSYDLPGLAALLPVAGDRSSRPRLPMAEPDPAALSAVDSAFSPVAAAGGAAPGNVTCADWPERDEPHAGGVGGVGATHAAGAGGHVGVVTDPASGGVVGSLAPIRSEGGVGVVAGQDTSGAMASGSGVLGSSTPIWFDGRAGTVLALRDWLCDRAREAGIDVPGSRFAVATADVPPSLRTSSLEAALAEFAAGASGDAARAAALMAAVLGYHRRERQPRWWAHIDRLGHPVGEWADAPGVLVVDWGTVDTKWHRTPQLPTMRRYLTLTGRLGTGATLTPGTTVVTIYDGAAAAGMTQTLGRRATATAIVLGSSVDANFDDTVRLEELLPAGCPPYDDLPAAIAPGPPEGEAEIEAALEFTAQDLLMTLPSVPESAVFDLLLRRAPRLRDDSALPQVHGDAAAALANAVGALDASYLAVHGPPGTGKTGTTGRVIERLVARHRWRIGVVAQSHAVIERIFDAVVEAGLLPELVAKKDVASVGPEWSAIDADRYPRFLDNAVNGCVIGGTTADFVDETLISPGSLDLLVVADAGASSLADTVAVAVSARNLLLIGDPVPARARAAHPEPVQSSALEWLCAGATTLPPERGYFLDRTWRMHPALCEPVSASCYDGRLRSSETITLARDLAGIAPGVSTVLVEHRGSATESDAEAREVVRRVRALLGETWTSGGRTRRLHPHDVFVVAPYAAQVARIRTLLARAKIEDVLVGTPDRFRGREAAVVVLSMTTSTPADAPFGMRTLLSRTMIHATLCRAMWKAIVIRSPLLTEYLPDTEDELAALTGFLRLG